MNKQPVDAAPAAVLPAADAPEEMEVPEWSMSRREMLHLTTLLGGGLIFGCKSRSRSSSDVTASAGHMDRPLNPFIHISAAGQIILYAPRVELGQGIWTGMATLVAEELGLDPALLVVRAAPVAKAFYNSALPTIGVATKVGLGLQLTGGSNSIVGVYKDLRQAAAAARSHLLKAGWPVSPPPLPNPDNRASGFKYIGKNIPRIERDDKITGKAVFGADVKLSNMLHATVLHSPIIGAKLLNFNVAAVKAMPGLSEVEVFSIGSGLAIVAPRFWHVLQVYKIYAANKGGSFIQWASPNHNRFDTDQLEYEQGNQNNSKVQWEDVFNEEAMDAALEGSAKRTVSFYSTPFVPHATMEPMNCTVLLDGQRCTIWAPTQYPSGAQEVASRLTKIPMEAIDVHVTMVGGGFGRRLYQDFVGEAVEIAQRFPGRPVKLMWTREEDMRNDFYRPSSGHRLRGGVDQMGNPVCWEHHIATQSLYPDMIGDWVRDILPNVTPEHIKALAGRTATSLFRKGKGRFSDDFATEGADTVPYDISKFSLRYRQVRTPMRVGFWRSVGHSNTGFVVESFIDELAHLARRDPVEFRRSLLKGEPRNLGVLNLAVEKANYHRPAAPGVYRGVAQHHCFGSYAAHVVEVRVDQGQVKVLRVVSAVDCGLVINPDIVRAQVESSVIFGLSAALKQQITVKGGRIQESNFHNCDILRMFETPDIEVYTVPSTAAPSGIGEPAVPPVAAALCNAIFMATKIRIKKLPIGDKLR